MQGLVAEEAASFLTQHPEKHKQNTTFKTGTLGFSIPGKCLTSPFHDFFQSPLFTAKHIADAVLVTV